MSKRVFETKVAGKDLIVETGQLAQFANGSVLVRYGDTVIMTTATSASPREGIDFFPLSVDFEEKMYSIGKIPGGYLKREARPSEKAVLTSRVIDRSMRPLFPGDMRNDVIINNLVMSVDYDHSAEVAAMIASSLAVSISDIPFNGPIAGLQVGLVEGELVLNPNQEEAEASDLELMVAGTKNKVCMIEAGANEVDDETMYEAIVLAHQEIQKVCEFIEEVVAEVGKEKYEYESFALNPELISFVEEIAHEEMKEAVLSVGKSDRDRKMKVLKARVKEYTEANKPEFLDDLGAAITKLEKKVVRDYLFIDQRRVDGRGLEEIRSLSAEIDLLPRVHGSGLFQRGETQVLTTCTLAPLSDAQRLDGVDAATTKRYMHHYNFPAYSVGEARPNRSPGRREIGHGALAERSLLPVLPSEEDFPYAIRTVSEIMMSNGSTSQGSVCASTLALMAAGVPIKEAVAGISAGLLVNEDDDNDFMVFMDIQGLEDFFGEMDFKVAGTVNGITSIQVDIKVDGLSYEMIKAAFALTKKGRLQILKEVIKPVIDKPRADLSSFAPKIEQIDIPADKIREVIGSGGKVIKKIAEVSGAQIDIEEAGPIGHVYVASPNQEAGKIAMDMIKNIVFDPEVGSIFDGTVTRLMSFGAFVEFAPGKEGLVHISKMAWERVESVEGFVEPGQKVQVKVMEIDDQGRINLSMRDVTERPEGFVEQEERRPRRSSSYGDRRGGGRRYDRDNRSRDRRPRRDDNRGSRGNDNRGGRTREF